jgi:rhamnose transport system permease protein
MSKNRRNTASCDDPTMAGGSDREGLQSIMARLRPIGPEIVVALLLIAGFGASTALSPFFLDSGFLFRQALLYMEIGIIALGETFIIISGNLDLSIAGNLAMVACVSAFLHGQVGLPMEYCIAIGLVLGTAAGALNGFFVAILGLPSLTVTIATMALYRGIAQILLGDHSIQNFPPWFLGIDRKLIPGTPIPAPFLIFLVLAVVLGIVLHFTVFGRWVYSTGISSKASYYSGVPTRRVKMILFTLSGFLAGFAGLMLDSRLLVARYDHGNGWELQAITAVVLGGVAITGGRGTVFGTVVALFLIAVIQTGMGVANVKVESQLAVIGILLVASVLLSNALAVRKRR